MVLQIAARRPVRRLGRALTQIRKSGRVQWLRPDAKSQVSVIYEGDKVVGEERLLADRKERLRLVKQAPDGALYVLTDGAKGKLLRVTPAEG